MVNSKASQKPDDSRSMKQGELALISKEHNEDPVVLHQSIVHPHKVVEVDLRSGETLVDVTLLALQINTQIPEQYFFDLVDIVPERHWRAQDQYDRLRTE